MMESMLNRMKNKVISIVAPDLPAITPTHQNTLHHSHNNSGSHRVLPEKFSYARPGFLQLMTYDELKASADHNTRPILVPRDLNVMPFYTGYAECVNAGKSEWNEDNAAFRCQVLSHPSKLYPDLPYTYFGIFDGHAGYGAALAASLQFHHILHERLVDIIELLLPKPEPSPMNIPHSFLFVKNISKDELIVGALEASFFDMDQVLHEDRDKYRNAGGCTALVTLFILGKMYIANAGDSRGILCQRLPQDIFRAEVDLGHLNGKTTELDYHTFSVPLSFDHTPDTERPRLLSVGKLNSDLMGGEYNAIEYAKKPMTRDLGARALYRTGAMKGWAYKTLTRDDLKMPLVTGEGKRSRLLGTIGVTRGFGDHDLRALGSGVLIKPFLSPQPDVNFRDLTKVISIPGDNNEDGEYGVLVLATDGLWDVTDITDVAHVVFHTLKKYPTEKHRYTMAAQELVAKARGRVNDSGHWRLADGRGAATVDDISVIVIPIYQYYKEFLEWEKQCNSRDNRSNTDTESSNKLNLSSDDQDVDLTKDLTKLNINSDQTSVVEKGVEVQVTNSTEPEPLDNDEVELRENEDV